MKNLNKIVLDNGILQGKYMLSFLIFLFLNVYSVAVFSQACPTAPTISGIMFSPGDACMSGNHAIQNLTIAPVIPGVG